jgi:D-alanyl-D-alanine carboxypeptidase
MSSSQSARPAGGRTRSTALAALVVASAALWGVLGHQSLAGSTWSATRSTRAAEPRAYPHDGLHLGRDGAVGVADGVVPGAVTVFDDIPAVANLDPALLGALRRAATAAADDGVEFLVNSGWRSAAYQEELLDEAVSKYGSKEAAARWVATPETSAHVSGDAVDIGHSDAAAWLSEHGAEYGLCQIYGNEPGHYELRTEAIDDGCPPPYDELTDDPRTRQ